MTETLRHDGDPRLARHVANAHARDTRCGRVIAKDTKDSPHKIDLAVAAVIAHERTIIHADNSVAEPEVLVAFR